MNTDWQSLVAICIALACTAWMVRYLARPFVTRVTKICRKCETPEDGDLVQIDPPAAREDRT